jgi:hypothetical protein
MANPVLLDDCRIWLGPYDLSGSARSVQCSVSKAELGDSRFGDTAETFFPGLEQVNLSLSGLYASSTLANGEPDPVIFGYFDTFTAGVPLVLCPPDAPAATAGAAGNICFAVVGPPFSYETFGAHGELMPYTVATRPHSGYSLTRGTIVFPKTAITSTTTGTGYQLGALTATQRLVATLHAFAAAAADYTVTIESDDNSGFTSATTRATFTATTAVSTEVKTVSGPVTDDYWRAVLTRTGGNLTAAVTLSIQNM